MGSFEFRSILLLFLSFICWPSFSYLLSSSISTSFFDQLRTKQQLGYVVQTETDDDEEELLDDGFDSFSNQAHLLYKSGIGFTIQSSSNKTKDQEIISNNSADDETARKYDRSPLYLLHSILDFLSHSYYDMIVKARDYRILSQQQASSNGIAKDDMEDVEVKTDPHRVPSPSPLSSTAITLLSLDDLLKSRESSLSSLIFSPSSPSDRSSYVWSNLCTFGPTLMNELFEKPEARSSPLVRVLLERVMYQSVVDIQLVHFIRCLLLVPHIKDRVLCVLDNYFVRFYEHFILGHRHPCGSGSGVDTDVFSSLSFLREIYFLSQQEFHPQQQQQQQQQQGHPSSSSSGHHWNTMRFDGFGAYPLMSCQLVYGHSAFSSSSSNTNSHNSMRVREEYQQWMAKSVTPHGGGGDDDEWFQAMEYENRVRAECMMHHDDEKKKNNNNNKQEMVTTKSSSKRRKRKWIETEEEDRRQVEEEDDDDDDSSVIMMNNDDEDEDEVEDEKKKKKKNRVTFVLPPLFPPPPPPSSSSSSCHRMVMKDRKKTMRVDAYLVRDADSFSELRRHFV